jgi:sugar phosphate isomerase/epimerase
MKFAICNEVYGDWPFEQVCDHAADAGYTGLEIAPFTLADDIFMIDSGICRQWMSVAERRDLEIVGLHWLFANTKGFNVTSSDQTVRAKTLAYLVRLIEVCRDLGGSIMVLGSPQARQVEPGLTKLQANRNFVELLNQLLYVLNQTGVVLAIEPLGPAETNYLNTAQSVVDLIQQIGSDRIRLHLDVKAMCTEPTPIAALIRRYAPYLAHFHANDPNRQGPGMGDVDFSPILRALLDINYSGWISVEVFDFSPGVERLVSESLQYLTTTIRSLRGVKTNDPNP